MNHPRKPARLKGHSPLGPCRTPIDSCFCVPPHPPAAMGNSLKPQVLIKTCFEFGVFLTCLCHFAALGEFQRRVAIGTVGAPGWTQGHSLPRPRPWSR